jgi:hypothetical protein
MILPVARVAQQIASIACVGLLVLTAALWKWAGFAISWRNLVAGEAMLMLVGLVVLDVARGLFRRERFFETR